MRFRSKIDAFYYFMSALITAGTAFLFFMFRPGRMMLLASALFFAALDLFLIIPILLNTYYTVTEDTLKIRCWICTNKKIPLKDITSIIATSDPSSGPALSGNRLKITYNVGEKELSVLVSPLDKQGFINSINEKKQA